MLSRSLKYLVIGQTIEEQIITGYTYRWRHGQFGWRADSEVINGLLRDASWLLYCIVGHPNPASTPSIVLAL